MSILGPGTYPSGILGNGGGLLSLLQPPQAPAYGSDAWAEQGGPGAIIFREMARAMAAGGPLDFLDRESEAFSPDVLSFLGPQFQKAAGRR
jgi:hypothetical protein